MSFIEGIKGARLELAALPTTRDRVQHLPRLARVLAAEVLGLLQLVPYGVRALWTYRTLPSLQQAAQQPQSPVLLRNLRYGPWQRNVIDAYLPNPHAGHQQASAQAPVALFVHGGVWATGDRWQYCPIAARLASAGIVSLVMNYTLYPQAHVPQMAAEVDTALQWTLDNVERYGGHPKKVTLLGHSAGAQLALMVLLHRCLPAKHAKAPSRMPAQFCGMAGVYDVARHLEYEEGRGVAKLSTMERAMQGREGFAAQSPAVILASAWQQQHPGQAIAEANGSGSASLGTAGQGVQEELGGIYAKPSMASSSQAQPRSAAPALNGMAASAAQQHGGVPLEGFDLKCTAALPPTLLMASRGDATVPWVQTALLSHVMTRCGLPHRTRIYDDISHKDFATSFVMGRPLTAFQQELVDALALRDMDVT